MAKGREMIMTLISVTTVCDWGLILLESNISLKFVPFRHEEIHYVHIISHHLLPTVRKIFISCYLQHTIQVGKGNLRSEENIQAKKHRFWLVKVGPYKNVVVRIKEHGQVEQGIWNKMEP